VIDKDGGNAGCNSAAQALQRQSNMAHFAFDKKGEGIELGQL
jgi:hypothetical protein